jgi:hypothetical protein
MIGGTACDVAMRQMGLDFRATKDLDIVLVLEALDPGFGNLFLEFVNQGQYQNKHKSSGKSLFYRFEAPRNQTFPYMLELFARQPAVLDLAPDRHLTPIPMDEEATSLSAILLDDNYYDFIRNSGDSIHNIHLDLLS